MSEESAPNSIADGAQVPSLESRRLGSLASRLVNLTRRNKTIRLVRKVGRQCFDLTDLHSIAGGEARVVRILDALMRGKTAQICSSRDEPAEGEQPDPEPEDDSTATETMPEESPNAVSAAGNVGDSATESDTAEKPKVVRSWRKKGRKTAFERLDTSLTQLRRSERQIEEETGARDLMLGWPFFRGVCRDGDKTYLQAPLVLFPVKIEKLREASTSWQLVPSEDDPMINETLLMALERFHGSKIDQATVELLEDAVDTCISGPIKERKPWTELPSELARILTEAGLPVSFVPAPVEPLPEYKSTEVPKQPVAEFSLHHHAVVGIFPQADSALRVDYEEMALAAAAGDVSLPPLVSELLTAVGIEPSEPGESAALVDHGLVDRTSEGEQCFVLPTDSSQEEVLLAARVENRLVVHGPPGTGKSQVIVNLIADALSKGERVALVCQKRAALDVVHQRMSGVGLGRHAALIHDHVGDRRELYDRIVQVLDTPQSAAASSLQSAQARCLDLATRIDTASEQLGKIAKALHEIRSFGMTAHQIYTGLAKLSARMVPSRAMTSLAAATNRSGLESLCDRLVVMYGIQQRLPASASAWEGRKSLAGLGLSGRGELQEKLREALAKAKQLVDAAINAETVGVPVASAHAVRDGLRRLVDALAVVEPTDSSAVAKLLQRSGGTAGVRDLVATLAEAVEKLGRISGAPTVRPRSGLEASPRNTTLLALETYAAKATAFFRILDGNWRQARNASRSYLSGQGQPLTAESALTAAASLRAEVQWSEIDRCLTALGLPVPETTAEVTAQIPALQRAATLAHGIGSGLEQLSDRVRTELDNLSGQTDLLKDAAAKLLVVADATEALITAVKQLGDYLSDATLREILTNASKDPDSGVAAIQALRQGLEAFDLLQAWDIERDKLDQPQQLVLAELRSTKAPESWVDRVRAGVWSAWLDAAERDTPALREVSGERADGLRENLTRLIDERRDVNAKLLSANMLHQALTPVFEPDREVDGRHSVDRPWRELRRQVEKKRRLWSLRRLVSELEWPLMRVMPCWLVSPDVMSAAFPLTEGFFDLVIFDEGSQCPVENGLPAIYRAKRVVVAGDDKQLQPFDLFRGTIGGDEEEVAELEDDEDSAATEAVSLLALARARYPERMLLWHYRSKWGELIDFSNHGFYRARLKTIPEVELAGDPPPIEYHKVDGLWENKRNDREAEALVAHLYDRLRADWREKSVGIVTFGLTQQNAILDHIEDRRAADPEFNEVLSRAFSPPSGDLDQALFVKNIENVQGDERDVIIFSIGYARDPQGRMVRQYGSLSMAGGENRLNVAVSRSRERVVVFASIEPEDLSVADAKHPGPRMFRRYLEYARSVSKRLEEVKAGVLADLSGGMVPEAGNTLTFDSPFEELVHEALEREGLTVRTQVGVSGYRIDLAVVDPANPSRYCLGIECDGATYHSAPSVRERDAYRQKSLEFRGWKIHRIWSRNWWANPQAEVQRVLKLVGESRTRIQRMDE